MPTECDLRAWLYENKSISANQCHAFDKLTNMDQGPFTYVGGGTFGPVFRNSVGDIVKIQQLTDIDAAVREVTISKLVSQNKQSHWFVLKDYTVDSDPAPQGILSAVGVPNEYDWIQEDGPKLYLVQESAGSVDLAQYLKALGDTPLEGDQIRAILYQLLWGAYVAHSHYGIAHHDIKPENIMVEELDQPTTLTYAIPTGRPDEVDYVEVPTKVVVRYIDVGTSRIDVSDRLPFGLSAAADAGTPIYKSPDGEARGVASDLWAIGVVATALAATGRGFKFGNNSSPYTYNTYKEPPVFYESSAADDGPSKGRLQPKTSMNNIVKEFVNEKNNPFKGLRDVVSNAMGRNGLLLLQDLFQPNVTDRMNFGIEDNGYGANNALFHPYFVLDGGYWKGARKGVNAQYTTNEPHSKPLRDRTDRGAILEDIRKVAKDVNDKLNQTQQARQAERDRQEAAQAERERQAREQEERDRLAREQEERDRLAREQEEQDRQAREQEERDRLAREQEERDRQAREQEERDRLAREQEERDRQDAEQAEQAEQAAPPATTINWTKAYTKTLNVNELTKDVMSTIPPNQLDNFTKDQLKAMLGKYDVKVPSAWNKVELVRQMTFAIQGWPMSRLIDLNEPGQEQVANLSDQDIRSFPLDMLTNLDDDEVLRQMLARLGVVTQSDDVDELREMFRNAVQGVPATPPLGEGRVLPKETKTTASTTAQDEDDDSELVKRVGVALDAILSGVNTKEAKATFNTSDLTKYLINPLTEINTIVTQEISDDVYARLTNNWPVDSPFENRKQANNYAWDTETTENGRRKVTRNIRLYFQGGDDPHTTLGGTEASEASYIDMDTNAKKAAKYTSVYNEIFTYALFAWSLYNALQGIDKSMPENLYDLLETPSTDEAEYPVYNSDEEYWSNTDMFAIIREVLTPIFAARNVQMSFNIADSLERIEYTHMGYKFPDGSYNKHKIEQDFIRPLCDQVVTINPAHMDSDSRQIIRGLGLYGNANRVFDNDADQTKYYHAVSLAARLVDSLATTGTASSELKDQIVAMQEKTDFGTY